MTESAVIRQFRSVDRAHVRRICYATADAGSSAESFFADREIFCDAVTAYYTDYQKDLLLVAESQGNVVGYLCGCFDTKRYNQVMAYVVIPKIFLKACLRGLFFRLYFWRLVRGMFATWAKGGYHRPSFVQEYPAHLHIDIDKDSRGGGIGRLLMKRFLEQARTRSVCGVHLSTRQDNTAACLFFEKCGFRILGTFPVIFPNGKTYQESAIVIYGIKL
ncbi:MAG TPA: GNAT family N-acetyltransferase [Candidatus Omnitrophota bacterium]|nr:GNAT family N-acetyltransferase [Candidatus Omnitrophota bacterium]HPT06594.1 GNAT family N-acetyltransferase [Candidatus Omnitrophota bacterium]